jgi:hypothetical protein
MLIRGKPATNPLTRVIHDNSDIFKGAEFNRIDGNKKLESLKSSMSLFYLLMLLVWRSLAT